MKEMNEFAPSYHEAAHGIAARAAGFPLRMLSIRESEDSAGRTFLGDGDTDDFLACAVVFIAGELAEKRALGRREKFNWFNDAGEDDAKGYDSHKARAFVDDYAKAESIDVLDARHIAEHRAYRLVVLHWAEISALAEALERKKLVLGDEVERILRPLMKKGAK